MFFKKKNKINSKFQKDEFVSFHLNGDLKHGVIYNIKELSGEIYYDIKVGGEATWLAKDIREDKILKINN
ncbi:MAG: hypothetical protein IJM36_03945 [Acholeplasmatales bacterium]|nr:hypothetical protein [Acholeplasmatales bacterium]